MKIPPPLGYGESAERVRATGRRMQEVGRALSRRVRLPSREALPDFNDVHVYGGGGLVAYGLWQAWQPGAWIFAGALLIAIGIWRIRWAG